MRLPLIFGLYDGMWFFSYSTYLPPIRIPGKTSSEIFLTPGMINLLSHEDNMYQFRISLVKFVSSQKARCFADMLILLMLLSTKDRY